MKKLFISFLAVLGILSVFASPIDIVDAQTVEIAPKWCSITGTPNPVVSWRTNRTTPVFTSSSGGVFNATLASGTHVTVPHPNNIQNGRRQINFNGRTGWVASSNLDRIVNC